MRDNAVSAATRELTQAVEGLHGTLRERLPVPERPERRYGMSRLARFPALRTALACCRDVTAGEGLVQRFKRVPDEYVDRKAAVVKCLCGAEVPFGDLAPCPGGCGRWFASDHSGAFAARFEDET